MNSEDPSLENREFELQLFAAIDRAEIELPKFPCEAKPWPALIEIDEEFQANHAPDIRERNVRSYWLESYVGVERKELPVFDKTIEGITVEMIAVRRIGGPIGVRIVRGDDQNSAAGPGDTVQLGNKRHHIRNMFGDMTTNDVVKFVIRKRIRNRSKIVNDVCVGLRICVDADRAGGLVPATTYVQNLRCGQRAFVLMRFSHRRGWAMEIRQLRRFAPVRSE